MKKHSLRRKQLPWIRSLAVGLSTVLILLAAIILVLSQGQNDPKDFKGKTKQVVVVPNGTVDAGAIEFREDPNHQGDPTPSPTPDASPTPSPSGSPGASPTPTGSPTPVPGPTPGAYEVVRSEGVSVVPGDTDIGNQCDDCLTNIQLPFSYTLYDQTFTSANVTSNGALEFSSQGEDVGPNCLPYSRFSYTILPLWSDLRTDTAGIFTSTSGTAPNRISNIEWRAEFVGGGEAHFEVRLFEGETRFEVIYGNVEGGGANATIGVQKNLGDSFTEYECAGSAQINPGTSLMFTLNPGTFPAPPALQISPAAVNITVNTLLGQSIVPLRVLRVNDNGSTVDVTNAPETVYESADSNVAIVDSFGTVAGVGAGSTSITVTNRNSRGQVPVTVSMFTPGPVSSVLVPGSANSVAVSGNYAYVAAGAAGLQVVDVSNRQNPVVIAALDTPGDAKDVKVVGGVAYLADGLGGLRIIDVSNPLSPVLLGVASVPGDAQDVVVYGGRAYVAADAAGLQIIDVNNPTSPVLVATASTTGRARGVDVSGDLALVACEITSGPDGAITVVNVSNPTAPQQVATLGVAGEPLDLIVRDRFAYVAKSDGRMSVVDFGTPERPLVVMTDGFGFGFALADVAASGRYAFFATSPFPLGSLIYDLDDPSRPRYSGSPTFSPPTNYTGTGVTVDGQYVYQTGYHDYFDSRGRSSLLFIGQYQASQPEPIDSAGVAPSVAITAPQNGDSVIEGSELLISATAADDVRVAAVRFTMNGVTVATDVVAPYQFTTVVPTGISSLTIQATAIDSAGNTRASDPVTINVITDPPPTVQFIRPEGSDVLTQGLTSDIFVDAQDNVQVTKIEFFLNGVKLEGDYFNSTTFDVPLGISSLTIEARATDNLGQTGSATRTVSVVPYTGPTTTVTGRVLDGPGVPAVGLTTSVFNVFTMQTGPDGIFTLTGVPTIRGSIIPFVRGQFNGRTISLCSFSWNCPIPPQQPVEGGVTDLGDLILTRQHQQDLFGSPTAVASGGITHGDGEDFFFGFENSNRLYWAGGFSNSQGGVLIPWTSTPTLPPFAGVKSADVSLGHIYAPLKDQPGQITDFTFAFNPLNFRYEPQSVSLDTGLTVECEGIAANNDNVGQFLPVLAFLGTTPQGAALTVRIGDGGKAFNPPVVLPTEPGEQLRTPKLHDINRDGLLDLLLIRQVSPTESHLVVYPRISANTFGPPVESQIIVRSTPATSATVDYAVAEFDASQATSIAILGDERVRFYTGDANGVFSPSGELVLPNGTIPTAVVATSYNRGGTFFSDLKGSVVVATVAADAPTSRAVHVFLNKGNGFDAPMVYGYHVPEDAGTDGARVFVSVLNGFGPFEAVAVDGRYLTVLYEVIPLNGL